MKTRIISPRRTASDFARALARLEAQTQSIMSQNNNNSNNSNNNFNVDPMASNMFPTFLESPGAGNVNNNNNLGSVARLAPPPISQQPQHQMNNNNGNGAGMNGMSVAMPMNAGQQMDVNMLYQKVVELSEVLKENREKTQGIVSGAEELAVSACTRDEFRMYWLNMGISRLAQLPMEPLRRFKKLMRRLLVRPSSCPKPTLMLISISCQNSRPGTPAGSRAK